jgi:hypothetical protein
MMLPTSFPDKKAAFVAAFTNRFDIGARARVCNVSVVAGLGGRAAVGLARDADHKGLRPILIIGAIGGVIIGGIIHDRR